MGIFGFFILLIASILLYISLSTNPFEDTNRVSNSKPSTPKSKEEVKDLKERLKAKLKEAKGKNEKDMKKEDKEC